MDFHPDLSLSAFREEVRGFLLAHLPPELKNCNEGMRSSPAALAKWQGILHAHGWGAPYWPAEHGGTGWSVQQRLVFDEECSAADAPVHDIFAHKLVGPLLNQFATPAQRAAHRPPILTGTRRWCQGFSEPGSGSDLASLRTRAVRDGDDYIVNGQKIWTTGAHEADWIFMLVRTASGAKKQSGISFLLVDMKTPGITVRPIISIDGYHHLNETFFDNVRVPVGNLVGEEGEGWKLTRFLLNNEHAATADLPALLRFQRRLRQLGSAPQTGGRRLIERPEFALRLARYEAELRAVSVMVQRVAAMEADHSPFAHAMGSMLKIRGTELQQKMSEFLVESLGDDGALAEPHAHDTPASGDAHPLRGLASNAAAEMFFRRATTIYGGSSEVQRGIVAKMMFQL
jgi:acyl-CoA dehydrogenase